MKNKITTQSELFQNCHGNQNQITKIIERVKIDTLNTQIHDVTHKYMTAHFPDLVHGLQ